MTTILDVVAEINGELSPVPEAIDVGDAGAARHRQRRRYAWRLERDDFEAPSGRGTPTEGRQIKNLVCTFVVTIEGKTFAEAWMLRSALFTAAGKVMRGHSNRSYRPGPAQWFSRSDNQDPTVCVQELALVVPFFVVDLPAGLAPQDAPDNRFTTVTITARTISGSSLEETLPP